MWFRKISTENRNLDLANSTRVNISILCCYITHIYTHTQNYIESCKLRCSMLELVHKSFRFEINAVSQILNQLEA